MRLFTAACTAALALGPSGLIAQDAAAMMTGTMPVYSKILAYPVPTTFEAAFENEADGSYILEFIPSGETVDAWTQMITVTGAKDMAAKSGAPVDYGSILGNQFKTACPETFRAWDQGAVEIMGASASQVFTFACGDLGGYSEMATILVAFGPEDVFTFQWAERGEPVAQPDTDPAVWNPRAQSLVKLRLCDIVAGEEPPYPSCNG